MINKYNSNMDWAMPFGSIANFLGQNFQGKGLTTEEWKKEIIAAKALAQEFCEVKKSSIPDIGETPDLQTL